MVKSLSLKTKPDSSGFEYFSQRMKRSSISWVHQVKARAASKLIRAGLALPRHYYEVIGDLKNEGEEYDCSRAIAHLDGVEFWVRNLEGEPESSFWIQTSSDKFYPDFVCQLKNGKFLVVEYKGAFLAENADSREKERLGQLWEAQSLGQCIFRMIKGPGELSKISDAVALANR